MSFSELIREPQAPRELETSTAAVHEQREGLRVIHEQPVATQEEIAAVARKLGAAVKRYNQMQPLIEGESAGFATATRGWRRAASRLDLNSRNGVGFVVFVFNY